jgi:hypothetical protein
LNMIAPKSLSLNVTLPLSKIRSGHPRKSGYFPGPEVEEICAGKPVLITSRKKDAQTGVIYTYMY